jgi:multidrug transporter EmrE-like cation transporter
MKLDSKSTIILAVLLIVLCETLAQACLKQSEKQSIFFIIALFLYAIVCYLLVICYFNNGHLGQVNLLWSSFSIISVIAVGYLLFDETIDTNKLMAISLAVGAIYFANLS